MKAGGNIGIRWGIAGPGRIAEKFADALGLLGLKTGYLTAVASTSLPRAQKFSANRNLNLKTYGSYHDLAADPDIDAVYVSNLHTGHAQVAEMMLNAGKAVLCEKPLALNLEQVQRMQKAALVNNVFLMEAMWTRFLPAMAKVRQWLQEGKIGQVINVSAPFSEKFPDDPDSRIFDKDLGGGGLLDLGVYSVSMAQMVYGSSPASIASQAFIGSTGVDEMCSALLDYGGKRYAQLVVSTRCRLDNRLVITGDQGRIEVPDFVIANSAYLYKNADDHVTQALIYQDGGQADFTYEIMAATQCISNRELECPIMSWEDSRAVMSVMDELRRQWGLVYPQE
jgi:predicted dehydrogenase